LSSKNTPKEYGWSETLLWLDARKFNHLGPLCGLVGDEFAEFGGRNLSNSAMSASFPARLLDSA
jgi:hypothetical protein